MGIVYFFGRGVGSYQRKQNYSYDPSRVWLKSADRMERYQTCISSVCSYPAIFLSDSWHAACHTRLSTGDWGVLSENCIPPGSSRDPANCSAPLLLPSPSSSWNLQGARVPTIHMMIFFSAYSTTSLFLNVFMNIF